MPRKPKTPMQMAYLRFRSRGLSPAEAQSKAKEFLGRYERLKDIKELGLTSKSAFYAVKERENLRLIQNILVQINPSYKISLREAVSVDGMYISMTALMGQRLKGVKTGTKKFHQTVDQIRKDFPISDFVASYARIRFGEHGRRPISAKEGGAIIQEIARLNEIPWTKKDTMEAGTEFYLGGKFPGIDTEQTGAFYERVIAERLEHKTDIQQQALRLAFHEALILVTGKHGLEKIASRTVRELQKPPSAELINNIRQRVRDFDSKPLAVRERIIQEARATQVGEIISKRLERFFVFEEERDKFLGILFGNILENRSYKRWIVQLLQRPGNRKFLGQLVVEWFSRRK